MVEKLDGHISPQSRREEIKYGAQPILPAHLHQLKQRIYFWK